MISFEKSYVYSILSGINERCGTPVCSETTKLNIEELANSVIKKPLLSVTQKTANLDRKNDYYSVKKYWWPNPETVSGYPYVLKDGCVNPNCYSDDFDNLRFVELSERLSILAIAVAFDLDCEGRYYSYAERLIETWFVDDNSRQNPNFEYSQIIPGENVGSFSGIIEARFLIYVVTSLRLLEEKTNFSKDVISSFKDWLSDLLSWLEKSKQGLKAKNSKNNIGFWYDLLCLTISDYLGYKDKSVAILVGDSFERLKENSLPDGSLPLETSRENPENYITFSMVALIQIAAFGKKYGISLWNPQSSDGRVFQAVEDWFVSLSHVRKINELGYKISEGLVDNLPSFDEKTIPVSAYQRIIDRQRCYIRELNEQLASEKKNFKSEDGSSNSRDYSKLVKEIKDLSEEMEIVKITYSKRADYYKEMYLKQRKLLRDLDQFDI